MRNKNKVLLYTDKWTIGGIESFIINLYQNINKEKFDVDIMCSQKQTNIYDEILNKDNKKILITLNKKYNSPILRTIMNLMVFKKQLKQKKYDVIHINIGNGVGLIYAYIAKKVGINKIIVHSHNTSIVNKHRTIKNMAHSICKYLFQNSPTHYLSCSDLAAKWLYTSKKMNKVIIINNAIDVEKFKYNIADRNKIRKELNAEDKYIIGHVGRFNEQKNHSFIVDIYYEVWKKDKKTMLLLVGEGELKEQMHKKVKDLRNSKKCSLLWKC